MSVPEQVPLFARPRVRMALVAGVGLYLFMLCASYIARDPVTPQPSYAVLGPEVVEPGGTFPVRVICYRHKPRGHVSSRVLAARIDDGLRVRDVPVKDAAPGIPSVAHIGPAPKREGPFTLFLTVENEEGTTRELVVPLVVYYPRVVEDPRLLGLPDPIPDGPQLLIELLPEGETLALAVENRVWTRVTDREGKPVPGVEVQWAGKGLEPDGGAVETDIAGLALLKVTPRSLAPKFELSASRGDLGGRLEETHHALGMGAVIRVDRMLRAAGEPSHVVRVARSDAYKPVWCDLYRGDAWTRTWHFEPVEPGAPQAHELAFEVDVPTADNWRVQCYSHFAEPGDGSDSAWLLRRDAPRIKATRDLLRGRGLSGGRTAVYRESVPIVDEPAQRAMLANFRARALEVKPPALVAGTRQADIADAKRENRRIRVRFFVLIALSFGLVILWALWVAIQTAIESRNRLAEAVAELGELAVEVEPPTRLKRLQKAVQVAFVIIVLVLNVIAMLELFKYM